MANPRRPYSRAEEVALASQVDSHCPLCDAKLFYEKLGRTLKAYEHAHIYPLNPTPAELRELAGIAPPLDLNHPDNIIPLCTTCHTKFDKPRTRAEYDALRALKLRLLDRTAQRSLNSQFPLESQIRKIVSELHRSAGNEDADLQFDPKSLDDKFEASLAHPIRRKIRTAVSGYYTFVRTLFKQIEKDDPASSELIFTQVRAYYLKQKTLGKSQANIFANVVEWIRSSSEAESLEAAEIVAAFFVQNCEVFE
jgi:hypothetical protein